MIRIVRGSGYIRAAGRRWRMIGFPRTLHVWSENRDVGPRTLHVWSENRDAVPRTLYVWSENRDAVAALKKSTADHDQLTLSDSSGLRILRHAEIAFIEGLGRYRRIHLTREGRLAHSTDTILSDTNLDDFEQQLTADTFIRLHRGYIVRLAGITRLLNESRRHFVRLDAGDQKIPVSRSRVAELKALLQESRA